MKRVCLLLLLCPSAAFAVPGPDSTAIVANVNLPGSLDLAETYRAARDVPRSQLCALDLPTGHTMTRADFDDRLALPLEACLGDKADRIDTIVLVRGVPIRVSMPGGRASVAAALQVQQSVTSTGASLAGLPAGVRADCNGTPCYAAVWRNPYRDGPFEPDFQTVNQGITYRMRLVTMLHARSDEDAAKLIASATTAEVLGGADGEFLFMNGADGARGVLDREYDAVMLALRDRGFTDVARVPFDRNLTGRTLASFFVGTAQLGDTIEGNDFRPGAIVDNLTSFGAVPQNFEAPDQERQTSIARWVARGVAGVHGTTDEPLNNCFPSRQLLVDYVHGYTLAEAYLKNMPFVYWRNLVLGDPMLAPYATRPEIEFVGLDGDTVEGAVELGVTATDSLGRMITNVSLYVDGELAERSDQGFIARCQTWTSTGTVELLAVAQVGEIPRTKGWSLRRLTVLPGRPDCTDPPPPDAGVVDAGFRDGGTDTMPRDGGVTSDVTPMDDEDGGCGCSGADRRGSPLALLLLLGATCSLAITASRRKRRVPLARSS